MNAEQLNAIKERAEKATSGPWEADLSRVYYGEENDELVCEIWKSFEDAKFIASAREDIPELVAEVERLKHKSELYRKSKQQKDGIISEKEGEISRLAQIITAKADANLSLAKVAMESVKKDTEIASLWYALISVCSDFGVDVDEYYIEGDSDD